MSIYFNGCSHTYGDDLADPAMTSWPALIAQERDEPFFNDARSGGANDRIVYRTIKHINDYDYFYVAWAQVSRFTRWDSLTNADISFHPWYYRHDTEIVNKYAKMYYTMWSNDLYNFKNWLQQVVLLQRFLEANNKPYKMINAADNNVSKWSAPKDKFAKSVHELINFNVMNDQQIYNEHLEIQQLFNAIDHDNYLSMYNWSVEQLLQNKDYPKGKTNHLLEKGHQAIADYILYDKN